MVISSFVVLSICLRIGILDAKLTFKNQQQDHLIENGISPLERKVDSLTKVVERLLVESNAKDVKIRNLENRVSELEKQPPGKLMQVVDHKDVQRTDITIQNKTGFPKKENECNTQINSIELGTVNKDSASTKSASEYKNILHKSKCAYNDYLL